MIGVELGALITTAATLEDNEIWLDGMLLAGAANVVIGTATKLVDVL